MTRPIELVDESMRLAAEGLSTSEVARRLGIPRSTVRDWLGGQLPAAWHCGGATCGDCHAVHDLDALPAPYVYLLGMYLGDGCLSAHPRGVYKLRISLDARYPGPWSRRGTTRRRRSSSSPTPSSPRRPRPCAS